VFLRKVMLALAPIAAVSAVAVPAAASPLSTPHDDPTYIQTRGIHKTFLGRHYGDWRECVAVRKENYVQNVNCSQSTTVSETVSGNIGYSDGEISAVVGFSVTYTRTLTGGTTVTIKPGGHGAYDAGFYYGKYTIEMEQRLCLRHGGCEPWSSPDKVTVQHHIANTFQYFGTGAEK
jgi:hypothetical protein